VVHFIKIQQDDDRVPTKIHAEDCEIHKQIVAGTNFLIRSSYDFLITLSSETKKTGCKESGKFYRLGEQMSSNKSCHNCYCGNGGIKKCKKIQCSPAMQGCTPVLPEGHCCPVEYKCSEYSIDSHIGEKVQWNSITHKQSSSDSIMCRKKILTLLAATLLML
jgi:hypothetical protein